MRTTLVCALLLLLGAPQAPASTEPPASNLQPPAFDIVILNGRVIDGAGSPWHAADVGIRDGHITAIGRLGDEDTQRGAAAPDRRRTLVREAMEQGAAGVSPSLQYAPAPYAKTEELIALATEAAKYGGIYATPLRSEAGAVLEALAEAIRIGREAHIPVEVWHLKAAGKQNWGRMKEIVAKIDAARRSGVDITADTYAYPAWFNSFSAFIPPWAHAGGDEKLIERLKDPPMRARIKSE